MTDRGYDFGWKKIDRIFKKTSGRCYYCGDVLGEKEMRLENEYTIWFEKQRLWQVDHIVPHSKGGSNKDENLVPACLVCNGKKADKSIEKFREVFFSQYATDHRFWFERENLQP